MKASIFGKPFYYIERPTAEVLDLLITLSRRHHDAVCRLASFEPDSFAPSGFLIVWKRSLHVDDPEYRIRCEGRELDLTLKIMEDRMDLTPEQNLLLNSFAADFRFLLRAGNRMTAQWEHQIDTGSGNG